MGRKLTDIKKEIDEKSFAFKDYLDDNLPNDVNYFLSLLKANFEIYIFSGVIRNYFLEFTDMRDLDIVIDGQETLTYYLEKYNHSQNSFGGYKIEFENINVDLWYLKDTWAFNFQKTMNFGLEKQLPMTSLFNFSAIIYDYNNRKFLQSSYFRSFLSNRILDIVYEPNSNYPLVIINTFYYSEKYNLRISKKLKDFIALKHRLSINEYAEAQKKHFGKVLYTQAELEARVSALMTKTKKKIENLAIIPNDRRIK